MIMMSQLHFLYELYITTLICTMNDELNCYLCLQIYLLCRSNCEHSVSFFSVLSL